MFLGFVVATVSATDQDPSVTPGGKVRYRIDTGGQDKFDIDPITGVITVKAGASSFNFVLTPSYPLTVIFHNVKFCNDTRYMKSTTIPNHICKPQDLWMAFVDLEKAFDRVPREVVWWAMRYLGVDEWILSVAMYEDGSRNWKAAGV